MRSSCYLQIVVLEENAGFQPEINDADFLDEYDMDKLLCEGHGANRYMLEKCGTVGKPGGKRRKQTST